MSQQTHTQTATAIRRRYSRQYHALCHWLRQPEGGWGETRQAWRDLVDAPGPRLTRARLRRLGEAAEVLGDAPAGSVARAERGQR